MRRALSATVAALCVVAVVALGAPAGARADPGVRVYVNDAAAPLVTLAQLRQTPPDLPEDGISPHLLLSLVPGVVADRVSRMTVTIPNAGGRLAEVDPSAYERAPDPGESVHAFSVGYGTDAVSYDGNAQSIGDPLRVDVSTDGEVLQPQLAVARQDGGAVSFSIVPGTAQPAYLTIDFGDGTPLAELDVTGAASADHQYAPGSWTAYATSYAMGAAGRSEPVQVQVGVTTTASTPAPAPVPGGAPGGAGAGGGAGAATGPTTGPQRSPTRRPGSTAPSARPTRTSAATGTTPATTTPSRTATAPARTTTAASAPSAAPPTSTPTSTTSPPTAASAAAPTRRRDPQRERRPSRPTTATLPGDRVAGIVLAGAGASPGDLLAASAVVPQAVRAAARPGDRPRGATSVPTWAVVAACALTLLAAGATVERRATRRSVLDVGR